MLIIGARLYYLRYIPHDWPQKTNVEILTQLREAMKPGYSRLIINEWIVPAQGASTLMTAQDMNMMSIGGGMERTEDLHRAYIEAAGLKISRIYSPGDRISESVIEAEVA
jgi:O-methyltransferase domain